jgi:hypothetical protein
VFHEKKGESNHRRFESQGKDSRSIGKRAKRKYFSLSLVKYTMVSGLCLCSQLGLEKRQKKMEKNLIISIHNDRRCSMSAMCLRIAEIVEKKMNSELPLEFSLPKYLRILEDLQKNKRDEMG